jgi:hypothetical protein
VSEIKFVNQLGDAIERSAAAAIARRRRFRRRITLGALGFTIAATGVAAGSGVFSSPEELAGNAIGCYDRASLTANTAVLHAGDQSPVETCRRVLKTDARLVACAGEVVHVFPGGPGTCRKLGLAPLPAEYAAARLRVNELAREVLELERRIDCLPPAEFAERVDALLARSGWSGWRTELRLDVEDGPCGTVSNPGGAGQRTIEGSLDVDNRRVMVFGTISRSLADLLFGPQGISGPTMDASGERCYTVEGAQELARRLLVDTGRPLTFTTGSIPAASELTGERGKRLAEGCAVIVGISPTADDQLLVEIWR